MDHLLEIVAIAVTALYSWEDRGHCACLPAVDAEQTQGWVHYTGRRQNCHCRSADPCWFHVSHILHTTSHG